LPTPPQPPSDHHSEPTDQPDRPEPEAAAYLRGFDDAQNAIDQPGPIERTADAVVIHDTDGRRLTVSPSSTTGTIVIVRRTGHHATLVTVLDRDNARGLSDALAMAAAVDPER
jgi:hypothetical protein